MKPSGLTSSLSIVRPEAWEDSLWDAVEEAISCNISPMKFKNEQIKAWKFYLKQEAEHAERIFKENK